MSPPANANRPSGAIWAPASPLSQPGGGANHVPWENGSLLQSWPWLDHHFPVVCTDSGHDSSQPELASDVIRDRAHEAR